MKEKKHYETPRFSVTQVITEGVFAASGNYGEKVVIDGVTEVDIKAQTGEDAFSITEWD